jgi:hypothetical protein
VTVDPTALIVGRALSRLESTHGTPPLPTRVDPFDRPTRLDPVTVSLAGVIVSAASLAWNIYKDLNQGRGAPQNARVPPVAADAIATRLREKTPLGDITEEQRREIIDVVAHETVALGAELGG